MKLFTLLAGYAAGLAVAMKYRKDAGTSKLDETTSKSKIGAFIDEVVDIHKTAFSDVKGFVKENFDDVENFDDLQTKVSGLVSSFTSDIDTHIEQAKTAGVSKKEELLSVAREVYDNRQEIIASAKAKAASFTGIPEATIDTWVAKIQTELSSAFSKIESQFNETETVTKKRAPRKAPSEKSE